MKTYLMAIHIGPVQDFIAAARKLRDLWFGSYLLSELSKQAALSLQKSKADLIFPNPTDAAKDLSAGSDMKVANKLLAQIATDDPRSFFEEVKGSILSFWEKKLVPETIKGSRDKIDGTLFEIQVKDFLEIYGAWVPLEDGGYIPARKRVDSLLTARKSLREFSKAIHLPDWKDRGGLPKSSLDGGRESVLLPEFRGGTKEKQGIKEHEELDALGWVKRHGKKLGDEGGSRPAFDSLSDLAADPFLRGTLKNPEAWTKLEELARLFRRPALWEHIPKIASRYDGCPLDNLGSSILFLSRTRVLLEEIKGKGNDQQINEKILKCIHSIYSIMGMDSGPLQYAAVLIGDGDNMGGTISSLKDKKRHKDFSRALDKFARTAKEVVEIHMGNLIYSGGDDVLAFVPLDQALECAQALQQSFGKGMERIFHDKTDRPTFSIGMAIVHHIRPMGLSLETARKAERLAKANPGKNSLAIILEKRGGAPIQINQHWGSGFGFVGRLLDWTECHIKDLMPDRFAYQLKVLARELGDRLEWKGIEPENSQAYEFLRILSRKQSKGGSKPLNDEERDKILGAASTLKSLEDLANELIITRIFAQAKVQAGYKE